MNSYENVSLLFPALLILAWPIAVEAKTRPSKLVFLGLAVLSLAMLFLPLFLYSYISDNFPGSVAHPAAGRSLGGLLTNLVGRSFTMVFDFGQSGFFIDNLLVVWLLRIAIFAVLVLAVWLLFKARSGELSIGRGDQSRTYFLVLAALWFFFAGWVPYAMAGYGVDGRVFSSAVFGIFPMLLLSFHLFPGITIRRICLVLVALFAGLGLGELSSRSYQINAAEPVHNELYRGLKEIIPFVKPRTVFVFIDYPMSNSGCGPSLGMLYDQVNITCAFFSSSISEYWAIRYETEINANRGGFLRNENWILIGVDGTNHPYIVDELTPENDLGLLIFWDVPKPIRTDYTKITSEGGLPSMFYKHLLLRQEYLGLSN